MNSPEHHHILEIDGVRFVATVADTGPTAQIIVRCEGIATKTNMDAFYSAFEPLKVRNIKKPTLFDLPDSRFLVRPEGDRVLVMLLDLKPVAAH